MVKIEVNHSNIHKELWEFDVKANFGSEIDVYLSYYYKLKKDSTRKKNWSSIEYYAKYFRNTQTAVTQSEAYARLPSDWKERVKAQIISQIKFETPC